MPKRNRNPTGPSRRQKIYMLATAARERLEGKRRKRKRKATTYGLTQSSSKRWRY